jgi:methionyl-tRNA synthetase
MSAGIKPPERIIAHGWWLMGGAKMSKSIGNVARYQDYAEAFGVDGLRYFVMREMPLGQDANFSDEGILTRYNADLANDLGNVVSRTMTMVHRYSGGKIPASTGSDRDDLDASIERQVNETISAVREDFEAFQITLALQRIWELIRSVNQYIVKREPWRLAKDPGRRSQLDATLYHSSDALRVTAALIEPVMPATAERIRRMLGISQEPWTNLKAGTLEAGTQLGPTEPLFPRIEKSVEELRGMATQDASQTSGQTVAEDKRISIDEFMKVDLRVAKVLEAEAVPKSKKLIKLKVDTGGEQRMIVAGIAEAYQPEQLVGRTIVIVANLQPAKLMGIESNGMVLAGSPDGGKPVLVGFDQDVPPGSRVR